MANITELLQKILNARYGKDVRGSIHDAIQAMNQEIEDDRPTVQSLMERAETAAETAVKSASASEHSKETADGSAKMAKSYTHGGTGLRENEDTDNAKYYKEQVENQASSIEGYSQTASDAAQTATEAANRAEQSVSSIGTSVEDARAAATSAIESASSASNDAQNASQYASTALQSAQSSSQSAAEAQASAEAAARSAEEAKAVANVDIATTEKAGIVKPDGTTITVDEDGTLHGSSSVDEMTGATADANGTSGTVPAPVKGQQSHILNGDGTWTSPLDNAIIAAKIQELNKAIEDATALRASLEAYGMVKLTDSSAVTDSTGLALPATEKNASIAGTLANQISQLNTDSKNIIKEKTVSITLGDVANSCWTSESENWLTNKICIVECFTESYIYVVPYAAGSFWGFKFISITGQALSHQQFYLTIRYIEIQE